MDSYIFETLMKDIVGHDSQPSAFLVYIYLWYETVGKHRNRVRISLQEMADGTGLSKKSVQNAVAVLKRRRLISAKRKTLTSIPLYELSKPWKRIGNSER
jgi:hypothetical protein